MDNSDNDDYELMPRHELDQLRREVSGLKKNSLIEGDKGRELIDSIDRLAACVNHLITILDDAEKDIIEEYQQSKPAEKINKLLEQNELIARALLAMNDSLAAVKQPQPSPMQSPSFQQMSSIQPPLGSPMMPPPMMQRQQQMPQMNNPGMQMNDLPPMDNIPPLDTPAPKKKFLGLM